jgi:hypothetical protein
MISSSVTDLARDAAADKKMMKGMLAKHEADETAAFSGQLHLPC